MTIRGAIENALPASGFWRSVTTLAGATMLAQALAFAISPLLSRLYTPAEFGIFASILGVVSSLAVVSSLSYEAAIPVARGRRLALNTAYLGLLILAVAAVLTAAGSTTVWLWSDAADAGFGGTLFYVATPLALAVIGFNQIATLTAVRAQRFGDIARMRLAQTVTTSVIQIAGHTFGAAALVLGYITGQLVGSLRIWRSSTAGQDKRSISGRNLRRAAYHFRRFPAFEAPMTLMNSAGNYLPPVILAFAFGPATGGLFALAQRVLTLPMTLVGSASGQVFFAKAPAAHRDGTLDELVVQTQHGLGRIAAAPLLVLAVSAPPLFEVIFGTPWRDAGVAAQLLTPWMFAQFLGSPVSTVWVVRNRMHHGTVISLIGLIGRVATLGSAVWISDWRIVVGLFSAWNAVFYGIVALYAVVASGATASRMIRQQSVTLLVAALLALPAALGAMAGPRHLLFAGVAVSGVLILAYLRTVVREL